jgi:hypothetical protein
MKLRDRCRQDATIMTRKELRIRALRLAAAYLVVLLFAVVR